MPTNPKPHPRRDAVFDFLLSYKRQNDGVAPSLTEIAAALGLGKGTVRFHLVQLEAEGLISTRWPDARAIQITGARWLPPAEAQ